jgi:hypothetical protein
MTRPPAEPKPQAELGMDLASGAFLGATRSPDPRLAFSSTAHLCPGNQPVRPEADLISGIEAMPVTFSPAPLGPMAEATGR